MPEDGFRPVSWSTRRGRVCYPLAPVPGCAQQDGDRAQLHRHNCSDPFPRRSLRRHTLYAYDAMLGAKRQMPLTIAGPRETEKKLGAVNEALMFGMSVMTPKFDLKYVEVEAMTPTLVGDLSITAYPAYHTGGTNPTSVRVEVAGKVISYTGDGAWTKHMLSWPRTPTVHRVLFYQKPIRFHMNYPDIQAQGRANSKALF